MIRVNPVVEALEAQRHAWETQAPSIESVRGLLCRPLIDTDIYAADHHPLSKKWKDDRFLLGAPYAARHARRACSEGRWLQGVGWAAASVLPGACGVALCCTVLGGAVAETWASEVQTRPHRRSRLGALEDRIARDVEAVKTSVWYGLLSYERRRDPQGVAKRDESILATLTAAIEGLGETRLRQSKLIRGALRGAQRAFARERQAQAKTDREARKRAALCGPVSYDRQGMAPGERGPATTRDLPDRAELPAVPQPPPAVSKPSAPPDPPSSTTEADAWPAAPLSAFDYRGADYTSCVKYVAEIVRLARGCGDRQRFLAYYTEAGELLVWWSKKRFPSLGEEWRRVLQSEGEKYLAAVKVLQLWPEAPRRLQRSISAPALAAVAGGG